MHPKSYGNHQIPWLAVRVLFDAYIQYKREMDHQGALSARTRRIN